MKKAIAFLLIICVLCSVLFARLHTRQMPQRDNEVMSDTQDNTGLSLSLSHGERIAKGGSYALETMEMPKNALTAIICCNELFFLTDEFSETFMGYSLWNDKEKVYSTSNVVTGGAPSDEGIWLRSYAYIDEEYKYVLTLISPTGEELRTIDLAAVYRAKSYGSLCWASGYLYIICDDTAILVISDSGEFVCAIPLSENPFYLVSAENGQVYAVRQTSQGNELYLVDSAAESLSLAFACDSGTVYDGDGGNFLLLGNSKGLYMLTENGTQTPIVIWDECNLSANGLSGVLPLNDGRYILQLSAGLSALVPVDPSDIQTKVKLTIADIHGRTGLERDISAFNNTSLNYYIEVVDYSDGGTLDENAALTRLNTEIMSGQYPDMVSFRSISPFTYISKGLLTDMTGFLNQDKDISLSDISISRALSVDGGIYYIGSRFSVESVVAKYSDFGDRTGWTIAEYLEIDSSRPNGANTFYNLTRESFVENIISRYTRTAVDWKNGSCCFDSTEFIGILDAALHIRENPEDPNNMEYAPGVVKVANGSQVGAAIIIDSVSALAEGEAQAGCRLSVIGWPTADGSCGSDIKLYAPVGIISHSTNQEGCWEFIKFMLMNTDANETSHLPVYLPALNEKIEVAKTNGQAKVQITAEDGKRLLDLITKIENISIHDETVMDIIREETSAMFARAKTAAEAARMIQSRVSIYVAEQYS